MSVAVLDDAHDEAEETLTLTLSNVTGAARIRDGEATGTIESSDPVPQAWLARFGRTVADHVVDAIGARLAGQQGGSHVTVGGQRLPLADNGMPDGIWASGTGADGGLAAFADGLAASGQGGALAGRERDVRLRGDSGIRTGTYAMTEREALLGSSFHLALGDGDGDGAGDARWSVWGGAAASGFDGEADGISLDGDVTTFTFGADAAWSRWLGGVAVALSTGDGGFRDHADTDHGSRGAGNLESTLASVHPYLRYEASERLSVWGILGYGEGELELEVDGAGSWKTDMSMQMAAVGARGVAVPAPEEGGVELAVRTDAVVTRTESDSAAGVAGNLAAAEADTSRLRLVLEGSRAFGLEGGGTFAPSLEAGLRYDGGDAETGAGVEIGGGVLYTDPAWGLTVDAKFRGLAAHEDADYAEWGASGSVRIEPDASGRGLSLTLSPSWGAPSGGAEQLWSLTDARGLAADGEFDPEASLDAEIGYGFSVFGGLGVAVPHAGWSKSGESAALRLGQLLRLGHAAEWRFEGAFAGDARAYLAGYGYRPGGALRLSVEATRHEHAHGGAPEHGMALRATMRW